MNSSIIEFKCPFVEVVDIVATALADVLALLFERKCLAVGSEAETYCCGYCYSEFGKVAKLEDKDA